MILEMDVKLADCCVLLQDAEHKLSLYCLRFCNITRYFDCLFVILLEVTTYCLYRHLTSSLASKT